jgi:hypothetical protein
MRPTVSRRTFIVALGGGLAAGSAGGGAGRLSPQTRLPAVEDAFSRQCSIGFVDYDGWILTTADKRRLTCDAR